VVTETPRKRRVKKQVTRQLKSVSPAEAARIADELKAEAEKVVEAQPTERVPGSTVQGVKVTYNMSDLKEIYGLCSFTPMETLPLNCQGVRLQAIAGVELVDVPICFKTIYENHMREQIAAGKMSHLEGMGFESTVELGAGALPPM